MAFAGGIIGLFSGMSILSLAEITYWILKSILTPILGKKRNATKVKSNKLP